jgi:hypothetical protein
MERHPIPAMEAQSQPSEAPKLPYDAPRASFVPLRLEERLLTCTKQPLLQSVGPCGTPFGS